MDLVAQSCMTPWTVAHQAVHGDSPGKNTGVGCYTLLHGNLPNPGIRPRSPTLQVSYMGSYSGSIPGLGRSPGEGIGHPLQCSWAPLGAQTVKNPPAMQETWVQSLGWEDPLEEGMANHTSILAWRIPLDRGAWQATNSPWRYKEWT